MKTKNNTVRLIGFLGNHPQLISTPGHPKVLRVSLAINETKKLESGNRVMVTHWHQLVFRDQQAELAQKHLRKGKPITVEGQMINRSYIDKQGIKRFKTELIVDALQVPHMAQTRLFD